MTALSYIFGQSLQAVGNYIRFLKDKKWGLIDRKGKILAPAEYERIQLRKHFIQTRNKDKIGAISFAGTPLLSTKANRIVALTPDLFLFTSHKTTHSISRACFVEVKRHDEVLSDDQINEINFLRHIGLKSRVFRLNEL